MKIVVTGGAGFLGSHLCDKLLELGHTVYCIDNLITGDLKNIDHLKDNPNFHHIQHDAVQPFTITKGGRIEQIYHLASPASPNKDNPKSYIAHPFETMAVNTAGTKNLCELAVADGARLLFASTSEIYGDPLEHPQKETYKGNVSTTGPRAVYDEAKRFGETIVSAYVRSKNLDASIVRIFNTYGPRMADDGRVVVEFVKAGFDNKPFPIFGDGKQTRSFCYVSDLVDGLILAMEKGEKGEVYNLGNPDEFTILELKDLVKALTNSKSEAEYYPFPKDDPLKRCPDITKAKAELGWQPSVDLAEGLKLLVEYSKTKK